MSAYAYNRLLAISTKLLWGVYDLVSYLSDPRDFLTFSTYETGNRPIDTVGVDAPRLVFSPQRPDRPRQERRHIELGQVKRHPVAELMVQRYLEDDWGLVHELLTRTTELRTLDVATRNRHLKRIFTP